MHRFLKVNGVQYFDPIPFSLQELSAFDEDAALGIGNDIRTVALHKIRLDEKAGLSAAGAAYNQNIFVSGCSGILGAIVHGETFGLGQQNIFGEHRVDIGRDVFLRPP